MKPALALLALVFAVGVLAPPASATETGSPTLAVEPSAVRVPVDPGETLDVSVAIRNPSDDRVDVRLAAVAATTAGNGGVGYLHEPDRGPSGWIDLGRSQLELEPGEVADVGAQITVPDDARPGDSIVGLAVWVPVDEVDAGDASSDELSARIRFQMRQIVPVVLTVPGGDAAELRATDVTISGSATPRLSVAVANGGDRRAAGTGALRIPALGIDQPFALGTVLPRSSTSASLPWRGAIPAGRHTATVDITDEAGRTTSWTGELLAEEAVVTEDPVPHGDVETGGPGVTPTTAGADALGGVVPMLAAGLAGALAVAGTNRLRRRRRRAQDGT